MIKRKLSYVEFELNESDIIDASSNVIEHASGK